MLAEWHKLAKGLRKKRINVVFSETDVSEFLIEAINIFKEGRECALIGEICAARNAFLDAIAILRDQDCKQAQKQDKTQCKDSLLSSHDICSFVDSKIKEHAPEIQTFTQQPYSVEAALVVGGCSGELVNDITQTAAGIQMMKDIDFEDPEQTGHIQAIFCVILADIISALITCEQLLGHCKDVRLLMGCEERLQQLLYGDKTVRSVISVKSIHHLLAEISSTPDSMLAVHDNSDKEEEAEEIGACLWDDT